MTEAATLVWDGCDRAEWEQLLTSAGKSPLEQCWSYGDALKGVRPRRGVILRGDTPVAMVQALERRILSRICLAQIIRGPVWLEPEPFPEAYGLIKSDYRVHRGALLIWMPELAHSARNAEMMRSAGLRRVATGYSSAWIDLRQSEDALRAGLHGKWRNALSAAERNGLRAEIQRDVRGLDWLLSRYRSHRRKARYAGPSAEFVRAMVEAGAEFLLFRARDGKHFVAGILLLRHGATATYFIGWSDSDGRRLNAHNLLLWRGMLALKKDGGVWLDVGGINAAAPGVARFKMGLGGDLITLTGTYI